MGTEHLVFHIGTHKTGSTAIQQSLRAFTDDLARANILYPRAGQVRESGGHLNLCWEWADDWRFAARRGTIADVIDEARQRSWHMIVLSAETFTARPMNALLASMLIDEMKPEEVSIVGYVRPQWTYLESSYTQRVKKGYTHQQFSDFISRERKNPRFNYEELFEPWLSAFGADTVDVRPHQKDVVADFWSVCGLSKFEAPRLHANVKPGAIHIEFLRLLTEAVDAPRTQRAAMYRWARRWLTDRVPDSLPFRGLTDQISQDIFRQWRASNHAFVRHFDHHDHSALTTEPSGYEPSTWSLSWDDRSMQALYMAFLREARIGLLDPRKFVGDNRD